MQVNGLAMLKDSGNTENRRHIAKEETDMEEEPRVKLPRLQGSR